jgi:hypothetical protein
VRLAGVAHLGQLDVAVAAVGEAHGVGCERLELADDLRGVRRGQQAHLAGQEAGGESHREAITIGADVEHVGATAERLAH